MVFSTILSRLLAAWTATIGAIKGLDVQHGKPVHIITRPAATVLPVVMASLLFFTWGLTYGILDVMNYHVRVSMDLKRQETALLALGYYLAYLPGAPLAGALISRAGYRLCMFLGMLTIGLGAQFMSLGASGCVLYGMILGHFVIGLGVSALERSANAYAVNCGPRRQAPLRILVAQSVAGVGTVIAPLVANAFILVKEAGAEMAPVPDPSRPGTCLAASPALSPVSSAAAGAAGTCTNLTSVITFYRALGAIVTGIAFLLAIIYFRTTWVPEVPVPTLPKTTCGWKLWRHPLVHRRYSRMWWGVAANFINLGCQVCFAQFFLEHMKLNACTTDAMAANWMSVAQTLFVVGRFVAAGLVVCPKAIKPRFVLLAFLAGAVGFSAAGVVATGQAAIGFAIMVMFSEAPSFPMIFESATCGVGEWTGLAETITIVSISGGGILPVLFGMLAEGVGVSRAWILLAGCFALVSTYPVAICVVPGYRRALDRESAEGEEGKEGDVELAER